ncbi:hypothetical protein Tsubulata_016902 [Turnera subulata]|uniref:Uncharacterized protein n=1 Tax=Turnera subulata TaxID=218843 RepID=A0A9Q0FVR4_9ROSI|nr:hypothetical protein Tsubulata_016902 [Turnera subulata]
MATHPLVGLSRIAGGIQCLRQYGMRSKLVRGLYMLSSSSMLLSWCWDWLWKSGWITGVQTSIIWRTLWMPVVILSGE